MTTIQFTDIGFSGSRSGLTLDQESFLTWVLNTLFLSRRGTRRFHHGDCVGADEQAAGIARKIGYTIVGHPPIKGTKRAHFPSDSETLPAPYLARNHAIVAASNLLIACPSRKDEQPRGGTWWTIRNARASNSRRLVIGPSGRIVEIYPDGVAGVTKVQTAQEFETLQSVIDEVRR